MKYIIVTPAKNEENYITFLLESVVKQSILPTQWVIVDDSSSDNTAIIVQDYCAKYPWIKYVYYDSRGRVRTGGGKVVEAFYCGYELVKDVDYDYVSKIDADLTLPSDYFEKVIQEFTKNPLLGLCGGTIVVRNAKGKLIAEKTASHHVRGALKFYKKECFSDIGGLMKKYFWDGTDEMMAMYKGWQIKIIPSQVLHHRPTSTETNKGLRAAGRSGKQYYRDGFGLTLAFLKSFIYAIRQKPKLVSGFVYFWSFVFEWLGPEKKWVTKDFQKYCRQFHYRKIFSILGRTS
ncbi:MAG: glycosyltransferase family 2 protein [Bacteroidetes bacterium]|nr:glycosyltransferase family 2 protein [Bacteroidota bacterium]MBU1719963.1 glycosyltransferase family 2 protein [Bacteroidota bacterium]